MRPTDEHRSHAILSSFHVTLHEISKLLDLIKLNWGSVSAGLNKQERYENGTEKLYFFILIWILFVFI